MAVKYYDTEIHLYDDMYKALMRYITKRYGLEIPYDYIMPQEILFINENKPYIKSDDYIPNRWSISTIMEN